MAQGPSMSGPESRFDGQIAIVTGAASGIGNRIAQDLVTRGARVFGVDVRAEPLQEVPGITGLPCDLADACRALLSDIEDDCGRVDILANVAGIDEPLSAVGADTAFYRRILEVNFFAAVTGTLAVLPGMTGRGRGSILNCSSDSVHSPIAYESAYVA